MYKLYVIYGLTTPYYYIGMTSQHIHLRMNQHRSSAKRGVKSPLYDCIRKHGVDNFKIRECGSYKYREDCCKAEIDFIYRARSRQDKILNLATGGEGGYVIPEASKEAWKAKLSKARTGRKPALGMKHTKENKELFSKVSTKYWEEHRRYHYDDIKHLSYREAKAELAISKTHYYRLLKQAKSNDLS